MYTFKQFKKHRLAVLRIALAVGLMASPFINAGITRADPQWPQIASVSNSGDPGNMGSATTTYHALQMSKDGRYVAFLSEATNFGAPGGGMAVYVRDLQAGTTEVGSIGTSGQVISPPQNDFWLSGNGRYLAFSGEGGIDIRDLQNDTTTTIYENGTVMRPTLSDDGSVLAFTYHIAQQYYVEVRNFTTNEAINWSGDGDGSTPLVSGDGRYVTYTTNCCSNQIYRYDLTTPGNAPEVVSTDANGTLGNGSSHLQAISGDGNYILFDTAATNITPEGTGGLYRKNMLTGITERYVWDADGATQGNLSTDGNILVYGGDCHMAEPSGSVNACTYNFTTGVHQAVSINKWGAVSSADGGTSPVVSEDGSMVAYVSNAMNEYGYAGVFATQVLVAPTSTFATVSDTTAPTIGQPVWAANPAKVNQNNPFTITASDDTSDIRRVVYTVDGSVPGPTNPGSSMYYDNGTFTGSAIAGKPGVYRVTFRAVDNANNWSDAVVDYVVLYDPSNTKMRGQGSVVPTYGADVMPGLIAVNQPNKVKFGLLVTYRANGTINTTKSNMSVTYATGTHCDKPTASNCHTTSLNATNIDWLTTTGTNGTNNSQGEFRGTATLDIDGIATSNPFKVVGLDGALMNPAVADEFTLYVYAPGANANTASPLYHVSGTLFKGNIKVTGPAYGDGGGGQ